MYKKLSNLNVGDIFQYGDTIYEIVEKGVWHAKSLIILNAQMAKQVDAKVLNTFDHWSYGFDSRSGYNQ